MPLESMEELPDDALLKLMQYVTVDGLLNLRVACKRLEGLVRHRDVWRHRTLNDVDHRSRVVLRLAPCLRMASVAERVALFTVTKCVISHLELGRVILGGNRKYPPSMYALVVRNQQALGGLRHITIANLYLERADVLMRTLVASTDLVSFEAWGDVPSTINCLELEDGPARSSLKSFECELSQETQHFATVMLTLHADTLEEVSLGQGRGGGLDGLREGLFSPAPTTRLLASLPRLRRLKCAAFPSMEPLASSKSLTDLTLYLHEDGYDSYYEEYGYYDDEDYDDGESFPATKGLVKLLRRARWLRSLTVDYVHDLDCYAVPTRIMEMVFEALSGLHVERIDFGPMLSESNLQPLIDVLPKLPALRYLDLGEEGRAEEDELLVKVTPDTAPELRRLDVTAGHTSCYHAWLHGSVVKTVLTENPDLHILVRDPHHCKKATCAACNLNCHQEIEWNKHWEGKKFGLFSHDPDKCPYPEDHFDGSRPWIHIECNTIPV